MRTLPRLCELYPGKCLTTEEKARKNLKSKSSTVPLVSLLGQQNPLLTVPFYLFKIHISTILSLSLFLDFQRCLFHSVLSTKTLYAFFFFVLRAKAPPSPYLPCNHPDTICVIFKTQPHVNILQQKKARNITVHGKICCCKLCTR